MVKTEGQVAKRGHLFLKRFADTDPFLTPGARKRVKHDVSVEYAPTSRGSCVYCGTEIVKGALRITLMLQCHKGYKNASLCHLACFSKHPESAKIDSIDEFVGLKELTFSARGDLEDAFNSRVPSNASQKEEFSIKQENKIEHGSDAPKQSAKKRHGKGEPKSVAKIKKPWNSFMHFAMEHSERIAKEQGVAKTMKAMAPKISEAWKQLAPGEKKKYEAKAKQDKVRWERETRKTA